MNVGCWKGNNEHTTDYVKGLLMGKMVELSLPSTVQCNVDVGVWHTISTKSNLLNHVIFWQGNMRCSNMNSIMSHIKPTEISTSK